MKASIEQSFFLQKRFVVRPCIWSRRRYKSKQFEIKTFDNNIYSSGFICLYNGPIFVWKKGNSAFNTSLFASVSLIYKPFQRRVGTFFYFWRAVRRWSSDLGSHLQYGDFVNTLGLTVSVAISFLCIKPGGNKVLRSAKYGFWVTKTIQVLRE